MKKFGAMVILQFGARTQRNLVCLFLCLDISSKDKWSFYCDLLIGLILGSHPSENVTEHILQMMLHWIDTDSSQGNLTRLATRSVPDLVISSKFGYY